MYTSFLFAVLFLFASLALIRRTIPSIYSMAIQLVRIVPRMVLWVLYGSTSWPSSRDRTRQRAAERFVPKRSKRP